MLIVSAGRSQTAEVKGFVIDDVTRDRIEGCLVTVSEQTVATTNQKGFFRFELPAGRFVVRASSVGYEAGEEAIEIEASQKTGDLFFRLSPKSYQLDTVLVTASREPAPLGVRQLEMSGTQISSVPRLLEADPLRSVQTIPGITSAGSDFNAQISLRGGSSDETLIAIDGIPVFNPYHFSGWLSSINEDFVSKVNLFRSSYPVTMGGYISGAMNIETKAGNRDYAKGLVALNLTSGHAYVEGPLGTGTFVIAARRMWLDVFWNLLTARRSIPYHFYDIFTKYSVPIGSEDFVSASFFFSRDVLNPFDETGLISKQVEQNPSWGNLLGRIRWEHFFYKELVIGLTAYYSGSDLSADGTASYEGSDIDGAVKRVYISNRIQEVGMRLELQAKTDGNSAVAGFEAKTLRLDYEWDVQWKGFRDPIGFFFPKPSLFYDNAENPFSYGARTTVLSAYIMDGMVLTPEFEATFGLRASQLSHSQENLVSPYAVARLRLSESTFLTAAYGKYYQYLYGLKENKSKELMFTPYSITFLSANRGEISVSNQYSVGIRTDEPINGISIELEGYVKSNQNLASSYGVDATSRTFDSGKAVGLDLLVRASIGNLKGWVGYSVSQSTKKQGAYIYYANADRTHSFKSVADVKLADWLSLNAFWTYASGVPYTSTVAKFVSSQGGSGGFEWRPLEGPKNGSRTKPYHRLDLGLNGSFVWGEALITLQFQVFNVYNAPNSIFSEWLEDGDSEVRASSILPSFGVSVEF